VSQYQKGKTNLDFLLKQETVKAPIYTPIFYLLKLYTAMPVQTDNHASTPPHSFFTGRMPFLPPSQQRQSTEGTQPPLRGNYAGQPALAGNFN